MFEYERRVAELIPVRAVSPQVTEAINPGDRLPLLSAWHAVKFPSRRASPPIGRYQLYYLVAEAHVCM